MTSVNWWAIGRIILSTIVTIELFCWLFRRWSVFFFCFCFFCFFVSIKNDRKHTEKQLLFKSAKHALSKYLPFFRNESTLSILATICPSVGGEMEQLGFNPAG